MTTNAFTCIDLFAYPYNEERTSDTLHILDISNFQIPNNFNQSRFLDNSTTGYVLNRPIFDPRPALGFLGINDLKFVLVFIFLLNLENNNKHFDLCMFILNVISTTLLFI